MTLQSDPIAAEFAEEMEAKGLIEPDEQPEQEQVETEEVEEVTPAQVASTDGPEAEEPGPEPDAEVPQPPDPEEAYGRRIAQILRNNPALANDLVRLERGEAVAVDRSYLEQRQQPQTPAEPTDDFWNDPEQAFRRQQADLDQVKGLLGQRTQQENQMALGYGVAGFRKDHDLDDESLGTVMAAVHRLGFLHPDSPFMQTPNKAQGVREAFEAVHRMLHPERALSAREVAADQRAKRKAAQASVSPRSSSRSVPEPTTSAERQAAVVAEFKAAMRGN